jgi:hypothetical protein
MKKDFLHRLFYRLTGGRPMRRLGYGFIDRVSGETVSYYIDAFGRCWMATSRWGWFRVDR